VVDEKKLKQREFTLPKVKPAGLSVAGKRVGPN